VNSCGVARKSAPVARDMAEGRTPDDRDTCGSGGYGQALS
jgi:hypothetical protein